MNLDDCLTYRLFKTLEDDPTLSQRALSCSMGISLGKINYCLNALKEKGWVKMRNFKRSNKKMAYSYILTPAGIEAKGQITVRFLRQKMAEYEQLRQEIIALRQDVGKSGGIKDVI